MVIDQMHNNIMIANEILNDTKYLLRTFTIFLSKFDNLNEKY